MRMITPSGRRAALATSRRRVALRAAFDGTPGRLRLLGIGAVLASLMLSLFGAAAFSIRQNALAEARASAAQLIRVQEIATQLVKADSLFTNGYLAYGLESPKNLTTYAGAISKASSLLAEASRASADDATSLAQVNSALTEYTDPGRLRPDQQHSRLPGRRPATSGRRVICSAVTPKPRSLACFPL